MRKAHLQVVQAATTTRRESIEEQIAERLRHQRAEAEAARSQLRTVANQ
jgi:hypothetical protein